MIRNIFLLTLLCITPLQALVSVKVFTGSDIQQFEHLIVHYRQSEFSQFPYLMDQGDEFEKFYASCYTKASTGALAVAYIDDEIAGFFTGIALVEFDALWLPFECEQIADKLRYIIDTTTNYYLGDVIVFPQYKGQKIVDQLFAALEQYAYSQGFKSTSLISMARADNHPLKPVNYKSPSKIWLRLGYRNSDTVVTYEWPTRQADDPTTFKPELNPCDIWIK
jgi:GNAT superfamily N-acetyltransferase